MGATRAGGGKGVVVQGRSDRALRAMALFSCRPATCWAPHHPPTHPPTHQLNWNGSCFFRPSRDCCCSSPNRYSAASAAVTTKPFPLELAARQNGPRSRPLPGVRCSSALASCPSLVQSERSLGRKPLISCSFHRPTICPASMTKGWPDSVRTARDWRPGTGLS